MNKRILILAMAAALPCTPAHADPDRVHGDEHEHDALEEIVVRATALDRDLVEISQSATVLSGEALQRELNNNIGETLTRQPGLANASFGQNIGRPVIRGQQGQRVGVLANNMASGDASGVSQDHAVSIEPFLADQVEVLRGPTTLLYGSGAIGGVVNVVTHTIPQFNHEEATSARVLAQVDSAADQRFAAGRLDFGAGNWGFHANAFYRRTDDYEIPGQAELYEDEHGEEAGGLLENSFFNNQGGVAGASWIGERWRAGASWTAYDSDYGIPGAHGHHHESEEEDEPPVTIDLKSRRWDGELEGTNPFSGFDRLMLKLAWTDYTHTELEGDEIGTVFDSETADSRLELRHDPWGVFSGAFGGQYTDLDFSAIGEEAFVPSSNTRSAALFWIESADFDTWQLDLGLRVDDVEVNAREDNRRRDFRPVSASLGAVWHVSESSHLSFTFARAERAPTAQELWANGPHIASQTFELGNGYLETETNYHLEGGYRIHGGRLTGSLVLYIDNFSDFIYQEDTGGEEDGLPVRLWSQQDADFVGGELSLRYDLGTRSSGHWQVHGFIDTVQAKLQDTRNVPLIPPTRIGLGLDWDRAAWAGSVLWIHADDHTRTADYETPTPGYDLLNAELSWLLPTVRTDWTVFLKGSNLLDEDIRNSTSYLKDQAPQIGRNVVLGVRGTF